MTNTRHTLLVLLLIPTVSGWTGAGAAQAPGPRVINVSAQRFEFWPSQIRALEGELLEVRISSEDTIHGFRIVGTNVNVAVPKRGKGQAVASFAAPAMGRYTIECNRLCGAGHNFMRATLVVSGAPARGTR